MKTRIAILAVVAVVALLQAATTLAQTRRDNPAPGALVASATTPQAGTAVLSVASGFGTQPGTVDPLFGKTLVLFKEGFENFMRRTRMFEGPPDRLSRRRLSRAGSMPVRRSHPCANRRYTKCGRTR